ncbi:MAG: CGNR zinc finger domain-containing protein [Spirochaetes bacterium]|nr:CGNR zinc finger domain-containing protein [Spirochaetota bacterium]
MNINNGPAFIYLINSFWYKSKYERNVCLESEWLDHLFKKCEIKSKLQITEQQYQELYELRNIFQKILLQNIINQNHPIFDQLQENIHKISYQYQIMDKKLILQPKKVDFYYLIHKITLSFFEIWFSDEKKKVKCCANPQCGWYIFDTTKNLTKQYCCNTCASLIKVRRFRKNKNNQCL